MREAAAIAQQRDARGRRYNRPTLMSLAPGSRLGPYEILAPLGAGGMGEVYRARDARLGREIAIKVLPASFSQDPDRLRRFEQEARAAGLLNHPNITAVYDIGSYDGTPYVVQELLEGETLRSVLAGSRLSPRTATDFALQIADGLSAAHDKGIVHRDLKPENLFVTKEGRIKILDFGLAKLTHQEEGSSATNLPTATAGTEPGVVLGTLGYMSPEQVRGRPADRRSDIFSFGAILYEMLSGKRAFMGDSAADTMSAILKEDPPDLLAANQSISPGLEHIVHHCLEKNPDQRFQAARDLGFALAESAGGSAVAARTARRSRTAPPAIALGASLIAILAAALVLYLPRLRGRRAGPGGPVRVESLAVLPLENFSRDPEQEYFADGMTEALISDLAQIHSLRVISRTSVMQYKAAKRPLPEIARALNVDAVVEGSVLRSGERVRITAQLIEAKTDRHLWAKAYERDVRDVLSLQSEVARAIAREIEARLTPQEEARLASARPINAEAHEAYLKGRYSLNKQNEPAIRQAIRYFNEAIEKDPRGAPAYAGLADAYCALRSVYASPREVMPAAKAAALKAVELDPSSAEAHLSLGQVKFYYDFDWPGAESEFRRAIELNPNLADAHDLFATYLAAMQRHTEAIFEIRRARELDPLSLLVMADAGWVYYLGRQYDRAIEESRKAVELDPTFWIAQAFLGLAYEKTGRFAEAIAALERRENSTTARRSLRCWAACTPPRADETKLGRSSRN